MHSNEAITRGTIWNRYFLLLIAITFCYNLAHNALNTSLSLYIDVLGGSTGFTGTIMMLFSLSAVVGRVVSSYTTDNIGRRFTMILGCLLFAVSTWLCGIVTGLMLIAVFRAVQGFSFSICTTASGAASIDTAPPGKLGLASSLFYFTSSLTLLICGIIVESFASAGKFTLLYTILAVFLIVGIVASFLCSYERRAEYKAWRKFEDSQHMSLSDYKGIHKIFEVRAVPVAVVSMLMCMGLISVINFIFLFASQNGIQNYGLFFTVGCAVAVITNFISSTLTDRKILLRAIVPCFVVLAVSLVFLGTWPSSFFYFMAAVTYGATYGFGFPMLYAVALRGAPANRRGAASSTQLISNDLGSGLGAVVWGFVIDAAGFQATFIGAGIVLILAAVLAIVFFRPGKNVKGTQ